MLNYFVHIWKYLKTFPWNNISITGSIKISFAKGLYGYLKFSKAIKQKSICEGIYANIEMPGAKYKLNLINHRHETNSLSPEEATWEDWLLHQLIIYLK
jgi:hypothetical protein